MTVSSRYLDLLAKKAELDKAIAAAQSEETAKAIATCRELIEQFGLTQADLFGKVRRAYASKGSGHAPVEAKYRDPATGTTWSGRGKPPRWIGENRDAFLIVK